MSSPSFFIVGAAKAGTTALYSYLAQHPDIYMSPIKEPNFFASDIDLDAIRPQVKKRLHLMDIPGFIDGPMTEPIHRAFITDRTQYLRLFRNARKEQICGEASASYLYSKVAAQNIHAFNKDSKIIIVLRDPVDRLRSHYLMDRRMGVTSSSLPQALVEDRNVPVRNWGSTSLYIDLGLYHDQVKRYLDLFPASQILILLHDNLKKDSPAAVRSVFRFLGVSDTFAVDFRKEHNKSVLPRNRFIQWLISNNYLRVRLRQMLKNSNLKEFLKGLIYTRQTSGSADLRLDPDTHALFAADLTRLESLTGLRLDAWKHADEKGSAFS